MPIANQIWPIYAIYTENDSKFSLVTVAKYVNSMYSFLYFFQIVYIVL